MNGWRSEWREDGVSGGVSEGLSGGRRESHHSSTEAVYQSISKLVQLFSQSNIISKLQYFNLHIDGLVRDCSNSVANALGLPQSCTKPSICSSIIAPSLFSTKVKIAPELRLTNSQLHTSEQVQWNLKQDAIIFIRKFTWKYHLRNADLLFSYNPVDGEKGSHFQYKAPS